MGNWLGGVFSHEETHPDEKLLTYLQLLMRRRIFGANCPCFFKTRSLLEVFRHRGSCTYSSVLFAKGNNTT